MGEPHRSVDMGPPGPARARQLVAVAETFAFFRAWIANPLLVAAVVPSGAALANLITSEISGESGPVLELGPGTGVFTRALLARGVQERQLTLIEYNLEFADQLRRRFPAARVRQMDAAKLVASNLPGHREVGAVVSGLPLLSMAPGKVLSILAGAFSRLRPGGAFYQFTYGPSCPVPRRVMARLGIESTRMGRALLNIPPAAVYRFRKKDPDQSSETAL